MTDDPLPFRYVSKAEVPDLTFMDAYIFFETSGTVEVLEVQDDGPQYWKVFVSRSDGRL